MDTYSFNDAEYGTHALIAKEIGSQKVVLDVGCNKGYLKILSPNNDFYGIDFDEVNVMKARESGYHEVTQLDLNKYEEFLCERKFDVIVFADVLEHLTYPPEVLSFFLDKYLSDGGKVIVSLPNVANITIRLGLLFGNFTYTENGILDKTHLHLYTKESGAFLLEAAHLKIVKRKFSSNRFGKIIEAFPFLGGLFGFNLIFVCQKK